MREILPVIQGRCRRYRAHPFIRFLLDEARSPHERLAYAPFAAHFVLTFSEFNRRGLHKEAPSGDWIQRAVNKHAAEDARHYAWFLKDLQSLGYDFPCNFTQAVEFIWSERGREARALGYAILSSIENAEPEARLVVIETIESMGNVWLEATLVAARKHPQWTKLIYFGQHHLDRETGHAIGSEHDQVAGVMLSEEQRSRLVPMVHKLYDRMEAFNTELLQRVDAAYGSGPRDVPIADFWSH